VSRGQTVAHRSETFLLVGNHLTGALKGQLAGDWFMLIRKQTDLKYTDVTPSPSI